MIADDNAEIREVLEILLTGEGYEVLLSASGNEALTQVDSSIDLIILDINMPGKNGFLTCAEIRKKTLVPILFLTARSQESDMAMGFSAGGDDYISKPFSNSQLLLRIKALLRRYYHYNSVPLTEKKNLISLGDLIINLDSQQVMLGDSAIQLTHTEYKILELLVTNRKKIFSMDNIYTSIWGNEGFTVGDNAIMVHIKNLRKKIEFSSDSAHKVIKTAWGKGYYVD